MVLVRSEDIEARKKDEYRQILAVWKWLKTCPVPSVENEDDSARDWQQITDSMHAMYDETGGALTPYLMAAMIEYLEADWKARKEQKQ